MDRRNPRGLRRGATRGWQPNQSRWRDCRAGRAISESVNLAIFDV